ncbi:cysteine-rich CWC family protein [Alicyclobacillus mengziensis]|uniref:Cysteine-rich CWC family protein n=1 Tax=Alicyclobacillus mengziensis TaxID=2931921 RepID=A0A9X7Z8J2_9BACL|nr:cysteine-rich CWC family protein [Alicyclobacillus mengziensis]QSO48393.1 cysteine-rich CWC family protein [Alicyclobacillus mengziensis]
MEVETVVGGKTCPICGGDNNCGNVAGKLHGTCWCDKEVFPQGVFENIPSNSTTKSCICQSCLEKFKKGNLSEATL